MSGERESTSSNHSFIVRIWWERRDLPDVEQEWRGVIEHVASGEHHYFLYLADIQKFIQAYLVQSGSG